MRSPTRRCRLLSRSVTSTGGGRHGGSIEGKGAHAEPGLNKKSASPGQLVQVTPDLSLVGVHFFDAWMQQQGSVSAVMTLLQHARQTSSTPHPEEAFPLVHHQEATLWRRWPALVYAPLGGIRKRTACDVQAHPRLTLQGRSSHSSTRAQFLGP